jgi:hypothetical protein
VTVGNHIRRIKAYENQFARYYGLEVNHRQRKGAAWDCLIPSTKERIEFKSDFLSAKTGNHFVEFRYSADEGATWDDSGITLAKDQATWWVVYSGAEDNDYMWFKTSDIVSLIERLAPPVKGIRRNLYGNSGSVRCEGYIVPLAEIKKIMLPSPIEPANLDDAAEELF